MNNTKKAFFCVLLMTLVVSSGCRYDKGFTCTSDSPDNRILTGLGELGVADLLCFRTNVSTAVASTNLEVAVAGELKKRYDWISVYKEPWEFDGCRHIFIHLCDREHYFGSYDLPDSAHIREYPLAEMHAKTYEVVKDWGCSVYVLFRQGEKWIIDWEKSTTRQPIFVRKEDK